MSESSRAERVLVLEYERRQVRNSLAAMSRVFDLDQLVPEAAAAVAAMHALDAVISERYDALIASCATEGHDWLPGEFGQEWICAVCGAHELPAGVVDPDDEATS